MPGWVWGLAVSAGLDTLQCARSLYTPHCRQENHSPGTAALLACSNNPHSPWVRRGETDQPPPPCPPVRSLLLSPGESASVPAQPRPPPPAGGETTSNIGSYHGGHIIISSCDNEIFSLRSYHNISMRQISAGNIRSPHLSTSSPTNNLHCSDRLRSPISSSTVITERTLQTTHYTV